jgi:putative FmdB family regulatory protein
MPIYEYRCRSCLHEFEHFQKITDKPVTVCPKCGGPVDRLVSHTSFTLKGGGWYKDGYATPKAGEKKEAPKKKEKKTDK